MCVISYNSECLQCGWLYKHERQCWWCNFSPYHLHPCHHHRRPLCRPCQCPSGRGSPPCDSCHRHRRGCPYHCSSGPNWALTSSCPETDSETQRSHAHVYFFEYNCVSGQSCLYMCLVIYANVCPCMWVASGWWCKVCASGCFTAETISWLIDQQKMVFEVQTGPG